MSFKQIIGPINLVWTTSDSADFPTDLPKVRVHAPPCLTASLLCCMCMWSNFCAQTEGYYPSCTVQTCHACRGGGKEEAGEGEGGVEWLSDYRLMSRRNAFSGVYFLAFYLSIKLVCVVFHSMLMTLWAVCAAVSTLPSDAATNGQYRLLGCLLSSLVLSLLYIIVYGPANYSYY